MDSTNKNNNDNQMFLCEFKELRKELSAMKTRIVQLEKSHEKQQEKIDLLARENHALKTELLNINGNKEGEPVLKRKRSDEVHEKETESKTPLSVSTSASASTGKKTKTKNNNKDDEEAVVISRYDNGDSFDSLSDDLLHKIVEFDGNCYSIFGSINKRCRNIYDVKEYKLKKQTCLFGYGTVHMILQYYLQKRREGTLDDLKLLIAAVVIWYNRLDASEWIIQLEDSELIEMVCVSAACFGRINILSALFLKFNLSILDELLNKTSLCYVAASHGKLDTLKWLRKYGAEWSARTFIVAKDNGHDEIVQYLRAEGCPETLFDEDVDEASIGSDDEDGDY